MRAITLFLLLTATLCRADLTTGLVGHWTFTGNANDSSGNANHGTVLGGAELTSDRFGNPASAYSFDGVDGRVTASSIGMPASGAERTFSAWFKTGYRNPALALIGGQGVLNTGQANTGRRFGLDVLHSNGHAYFVGQGADVDSGVVVDDNQWHHAVVTFKAQQVRVYVDGGLAASGTAALDTAAAPLQIGAVPEDHGGFNQLFFNGKIDDVRIYNRALSPAEVQQLYVEPSPPLAITLTVSPPATPVQRPATHALEGTFAGGDGSVTEVSFYDNGVFLGTAPVSAPGLAVFNLLDTSAGIHRYTARVSDADEMATSNEVEYVVTLAPPPVLSLVAVEDPMPGSALLEGTVLPSPYPATVTVEWGLTTAYGSTVVVNYPFYSIEQPVDILLTGLRADTTYHFRVTAANVDASVTQPDSTFTTAPSPPPVVQVLAQAGIVAGNRIGTDLEDAPGFKLASMGTPSLTNLRRVAVTAVAKDNFGRRMTGIAVGRFDDADIVHFTMPLRVGGAVPDALGTGLTWKAFPKEPFMDYTDDAFLSSYPSAAKVPMHMGFFGRMSGVGVTTGSDEVLAVVEFLEGDPDQPIIIGSMREGDPVRVVGTQADPGRIKSFVSAALAARRPSSLPGVGHSPAMAFTAMLQTGPSGTPGPGGVDKNSDMALFIFDDVDGTETVKLVLREGDVLGAGTVRSFVALRGPVGHGHGFTADDDPDHSSVPAAEFSTTALITFTNGTKQLVAVSRGGVKPLATAKTADGWAGTGAWPGWATFPWWFRNGDGRIGVLATLTSGGGVTSANNAAILAEDDNGDLQRLVTKGDLTGDGAFITGLKTPILNRDGGLAFTASVKTGAATAQRGYFRDPEGSLLPFIEQGAAAVSANGGVWRTTNVIALPDGMGPLFTAKLRAGSLAVPAPGGVTALNDVGLWAVDSFGTTHLLVREGQSLAGKTVRTFKALTTVSGSPAQARSSNGHRDVLVWVLATDYSQHLVLFAVP